MKKVLLAAVAVFAFAGAAHARGLHLACGDNDIIVDRNTHTIVINQDGPRAAKRTAGGYMWTDVGGYTNRVDHIGDGWMFRSIHAPVQCQFLADD
jgi:hypothetical protein